MKKTKHKIMMIYLSWWNKRTPINLFAENHKIDYERVKRIIEIGGRLVDKLARKRWKI